MTRPHSTLAEPTGAFTDALSGADGTADPVLAVQLPEGFADPMADQFRGQQITVHPPTMPRVQMEAPSFEDWFDIGDGAPPSAGVPGAGLPSAGLSGGAPRADGSAERAAAARRASAARRDAAVASRLRTPGVGPGVAPALPRGHGPMRLAQGDRRPMPGAYAQPGA
ncbi:MAG: hypothetical protein ABI382_05330, partial [Nakamurella sp.]